jgi:hypothetical protein
MKASTITTHMLVLKRVEEIFGMGGLDKRGRKGSFNGRRFFNIFVAYLASFDTFAHS